MTRRRTREPPPRIYHPTRGVALGAIALFAVLVGIALYTAWSDTAQLEMCDRWLADDAADPQDTGARKERIERTAAGALAITLLTIPVFLVWWWRLYANLAVLGAKRLSTTPNWAVGAWFVPIWQLFQPLLVAQEVWRVCSPEDRPAKGSPLLLAWWLTNIACGLLRSVAQRREESAWLDAKRADFDIGALDFEPATEALRSATQVLVAAHALWAAAPALALVVVWKLDARQRGAWHLWPSS